MEGENVNYFIDWVLVSNGLSSILGEGVQQALLLQEDGSLLASAGEKNTEKVRAALVGNIWRLYEEEGEVCLKEEEEEKRRERERNNAENEETADFSPSSSSSLSFLLLDCQEGQLYLTRISRFLLCVVAQKNVPSGAFKLKVNVLKQYFQPLNKVFSN